MRKIIQTKYQCCICKKIYDSKKEALSCEERPISKDKNVKEGDIVVITSGDGQGMEARVTSVGILDKYYGHYQGKRYWHTVYITADVINKYGSRILLFDSYTKK